MKKIFITVSSIVVALVLSSCGPKDIQPVTALPASISDDVDVTGVNVKWSSEYVALVENEKTELRELEEKYEVLSEKKSRNKSSRTLLKKKISKKKRRIKGLDKELVDVPLELKASIENILAVRLKGNTPVSLEVVVNSFAMTNGAAVMLIGGSDSMAAVVSIIEDETQNVVGEYFITDHDSNAAGGLLGLMVRGTDPRGDMVRQFSEKVLEAVYGYPVR